MNIPCSVSLDTARFNAQQDHAHYQQQEITTAAASITDRICRHTPQLHDFAVALNEGEYGLTLRNSDLAVLLAGLIYPTPSTDDTPGSHEAAVELAHSLMRQYAVAEATEQVESDVRHHEPSEDDMEEFR